MAIVTFFFGLALILLVVGAVLGFAAWAVNEHVVANKYRHLIALYQCLPKEVLEPKKINGNQWRVTYKVGRKQEETLVEGSSEGAALAVFLRGTVKYDSIVKMERA